MTHSNSQFPIIALQLYTVRDELKKDCDKALQRIADIGFQYVEIADTGTMTIPEFVKKLRQYNLTPISTHVDFLMLRQNPQSFFNEVQESGISKVVVPWIDPQIWQDETLLSSVLNELEQIGNQAKQQGLSISYHNHAHELSATAQGYFLDILVTHTQSINIELDLGWAYVATHKNPLLIAKRYNTRISLFHLKDVREIEPLKFTELGNNGKIDWRGVLAEVKEMNSGEWIIEQDTDFENNSLDSAERSYQYLMSLLEQ
ncbi:MAG: sugar phosphate isomerase/epimerase family protein [Candidatus Hydrogenedens sp.]